MLAVSRHESTIPTIIFHHPLLTTCWSNALHRGPRCKAATNTSMPKDIYFILRISRTMRPFWLFSFAPYSKVQRGSTPSLTFQRYSSSASMPAASKSMVVDPFCFRQFSEHATSESYGGTVFQQTVAEFEDIVNARFATDSLLKDGYAPFCKHLFLENDFTEAKVNVLQLTKENEGLVRTEYHARNEKELPILQRFILSIVSVVRKITRYVERWNMVRNFSTEDPSKLMFAWETAKVAKYLDLILYSREQIQKENESMGKPSGDEVAPWGIVSIKAQDVDYELPMNPITIMRNSLGKDQGGSGVALDRDAYMASVSYWKDHVVIS